jgi:hypothetical protein
MLRGILLKGSSAGTNIIPRKCPQKSIFLGNPRSLAGPHCEGFVYCFVARLISVADCLHDFELDLILALRPKASKQCVIDPYHPASFQV